MAQKDKIVKIPLTEKNLDTFLKLRFAEYDGEYIDKADMTKDKCSQFESWAIDWLAEWMNCHIPKADTGWQSKPQPEKED